MEYDYYKNIDNAIRRCKDMDADDGANKWNFYKMYPFTTENINGYIDNFSLEGKSLLTVGSSTDQVLNAILKGSADITLLDICPYVKYYYYLKLVSILKLTREEFLSFFRYIDFPELYMYNKNVFKREVFEKIKMDLRVIDYESYLFWDELLQVYGSIVLRKKLFSNDEYRTDVITSVNAYLQNEENYNNLKDKILKVKPKFITSDAFNFTSDRCYDNIWLSNIGSRMAVTSLKILAYKMNKYLNKNGLMLISYLYDCTKDTIYNPEWKPLYNLKETFKILEDFNPELKTFKGVDSLKFPNNNMCKDSIILSRKK